jgi:outer membrane protein
MRKRYFLLAGVLALVALTGRAQTTGGQLPTERYTLQRCLEIAWANNIQVRQSQLQVEASRNTLEQSRASQLPNLNGNVTGPGLSFGRGIDPFTNTAINQQITFNNFNLTTNTTLFAGGQLRNVVKQNELTVQAAQQDVQANRDQLTLNVVLAYLQVVNNEDLLAIARGQVEVSQLQVERTQKLVDAGSLPPANLYDLQAQLANDELAVVNAENNLILARVNLLQLMNVNGLQNIELDRLSVNTPTGPYPQTPQEVYDVATGFVAAVKAADLRTQSAGRGVEIARGALAPTVGFNASLSTNYSSAAQRRVLGNLVDVSTTATVVIDGQPTPITFVTQQPSQSFRGIGYFDQLASNRNANLSIGLRIPIFNAYTARTQVANAQVNERNLAYQAENVRLQLRQTIEQAFTNLTTAAKRYAATTKQVEALEQAFRVAESRLNAGAINSVDYNVAKTNLDRARSNQVQAKYDYLFRTKILDFYQNKPLSF